MNLALTVRSKGRRLNRTGSYEHMLQQYQGKGSNVSPKIRFRKLLGFQVCLP